MTSFLARALPALRVVGYGAAVAIVAYMAVRASRDVDLAGVSWWPLALALAAATAWWLLQAHGWAILVGAEARRANVAIWCRTQALRYLPGGIWAPASRAAIVRGSIVDRIATAATDQVIAVCAAAALGALGLAAGGQLRWLPLLAVVAMPVVASWVVARRTRVAPRRTLRVTWNFLAAFAAYGVAAVLAQGAVSGFGDPFLVAGAALLAWAAGFLFVIAPSGLGVREVAYVALVASALPSGEAAAAALALRIVTIVAELGVLVVVGRPRRTEPATVTRAGSSED